MEISYFAAPGNISNAVIEERITEEGDKRHRLICSTEFSQDAERIAACMNQWSKNNAALDLLREHQEVHGKAVDHAIPLDKRQNIVAQLWRERRDALLEGK